MGTFYGRVELGLLLVNGCGWRYILGESGWVDVFYQWVGISWGG